MHYTRFRDHGTKESFTQPPKPRKNNNTFSSEYIFQNFKWTTRYHVYIEFIDSSGLNHIIFEHNMI